MNPEKLYMDARPAKQPEGTYPYGKNGIRYETKDTVFNEPGFNAMEAEIPYQFNGVVESENNPVIFSTDDTNSAIGFFNAVTGLYEAIINDSAESYKLGFKKDKYITGTAQRNFKGELVVVFTDKTTFPKYLNCDTPNITDLDDFRLFPNFTDPIISAIRSSGGILPAGTYYIAIGYEKADGTSTGYSATTTGLILPRGTSGIDNYAIEVHVTNVDTSYDFLRVAVISNVNGVEKTVALTNFIPIGGPTVNFTYTGAETSEDISLSQVTTPSARYDIVDTITQLNDSLYIGDLHEEADLNMQAHAIAVQVKWQSDLIINAVTPGEDHITGKVRSFMHEEVYAFYIRYHKTAGGFSQWFVTTGTAPDPADTADSTESVSGGEVTPIPKYKVEDTIHSFSTGPNIGETGVWVNETELYPDTIEFDASAIAGGTNLRGQPVRHHKMPSLRWMKDNIYSGQADYGKLSLDLLSIYAENVVIPAQYTDIIDGYQLGFAKRTVANMTVYGQSVVLHSGSDGERLGETTDTTLLFQGGGNWRAGKDGEVVSTNYITPRMDCFRFYSFDMLFNRPAVSPSFVSVQFMLERTNLRADGYYEDGQSNDGGCNDLPTVQLIDYVTGTDPVYPSAGAFLRKVISSFYLTNSINYANFINYRHENTFAGILDTPSNWALSMDDFAWQGDCHTDADHTPDKEQAWLCNMISVKTDLYNTFYSQEVVAAGDPIVPLGAGLFKVGDIFISPYTFHTYGRHASTDEDGDGYRGKKVIRRFICEAASNINLRYEIPGNEYSKWWPNNGIAKQSPGITYPVFWDRSIDPNQFGYTNSFNALNDLVQQTIFSPFREVVLNHPYRIHRGGKNIRTGVPRSWRTFLALDYYEMPKNLGKIINLEGMDDTLLIHMQSALFRTRDKLQLEADVLKVTLGSGDIFQFEPQETLSAKLGYAGTQHDLACIRTPAGYFFPDAKIGELFLLKDGLQNLNLGVNAFLRNYLTITDKNPFNGNGITAGYDQKFKRLLITVKKESVEENVVLYGFHGLMGFSARPFSNPDVLDAIENLGPFDIMRFPGGPIADVYNWHTGMDDAATQKPNTLEDIAALHARTGCHILFNLNMVSKSIPDQLEMLAEAEDLGIPIKYIELGNEVNNLSSTGHAAFPTVELYSAACAVWGAAIRAVYPGILIGGTGGNKGWSPNWNDVMISDSGCNALVWHEGPETEQFATDGIADLALLDAVVEADFIDLGFNLVTIPIWPTEYNYNFVEADALTEDSKIAVAKRMTEKISELIRSVNTDGIKIMCLRGIEGPAEGALFIEKKAITLQATGIAMQQFLSELPDIEATARESFTMSHSIGNGWVMFHDYIPDMYFHTRKQLWSIKTYKEDEESNSIIYKHNVGLPGVYYDNTPKPFFVDMTFSAESEFILEAIMWITEVLSSSTEQKFSTLTHITIWNSAQHSGRISLAQIFESLEYKNIRNTMGEWSFDNFLDKLVETSGATFLQDIFHDYLVDPVLIAPAGTKAFYNRKLMQDKWFCVRFEYDNTSGNTLHLHSANLSVQKAIR